MPFKIERIASGEDSVVLRLCGRIRLEHVDTIKELIEREKNTVALDLAEVTLVDRDAVNVLADCERRGIELRNCPAFLQEWISKEKSRATDEPADC